MLCGLKLITDKMNLSWKMETYDELSYNIDPYWQLILPFDEAKKFSEMFRMFNVYQERGFVEEDRKKYEEVNEKYERLFVKGATILNSEKIKRDEFVSNHKNLWDKVDALSKKVDKLLKHLNIED